MYYAHPAIRIHPPGTVYHDKWTIDHLVSRKCYAVDDSVCAVLVSCFGENDFHSSLAQQREISAHLGLRDFEVSVILERLAGLGILSDKQSHQDYQWRSHFKRWTEAGWIESAAYQAATYDYGFADYPGGGRRVDLERMAEYSRVSPDCNRVKRYPNNEGTVLADTPKRELLSATLTELFDKKVPPKTIDKNSLLDLMTMAFGATRKINLVSPGASPVINRTSPSGGSRHPSEGYVVIVDVDGIESGWYHFVSDSYELERMKTAFYHDRVKEVFFGAYSRCPFVPRAIVLITSVFERNMYRYREPRTFRTIHMDVGHLVGTLVHFCRALGLRAAPDTAFDEAAAEAAIDTDYLVEGAIYSVALGDGRKEAFDG